jgi:hypothetical protein
MRWKTFIQAYRDISKALQGLCHWKSRSLPSFPRSQYISRVILNDSNAAHLYYTATESCMNGIYVISRKSYIKASIIRIKTTEQCFIEEAIKLASNGMSYLLLSHARISDGYQLFLNAEADGKMICQKILDALFYLPDGNVVIERINC